MANYQPVFWSLLAALGIIVAYCDLKYNMLRDASTAGNKPYSWGRVQLAWWMIIILATFITIIIVSPGHQIPALDSSTLILLGITTGTTAVARLIDVSDRQNPALSNLLQDQPKQNFLLDILSDGNGVSIHRLQAVIFNIVFGLWFISYALQHFANPCMGLVAPGLADCTSQPWNYVIPVIAQNNLILLGLSSAAYATLKSAENSPSAPGNSGQVLPQALPAATQVTPMPGTEMPVIDASKSV